MSRQKNWSYNSYDESEDISVIGNYIWDSNTLAWIKQTPAASGGGGPVTIADGDDTAQGTRSDAAWVSGNGTVISLLKAIASASGSGGLTDAQLRATPVPVSGPLTDLQLRASAVAISGTVSISGTVPVSGPLTDTQLRATPVPVSGTVNVGTVPVTGPLTDTQLRATPVPVSGTVTATGPLTDTQLRATPVPVSGSVTVSGTVTVSGDQALTDTQLRASAVPVSAATLPLPANAAQETGGNLAALNAALGVASVEKPGVNTVLDRLLQLGTKIDSHAKLGASEATQRLVLAALTKPSPKSSYSTLLHRSI